MDLSDAIKAHAEWNITFRSAISRKDTIDAAMIAADNCCALGKWLHGEARVKFGQLKSFAECVALHAHFHREAGKVAQTINARQFDEAKAMIGPGTPFFIASQNVIAAIGVLRGQSVDSTRSA